MVILINYFDSKSEYFHVTNDVNVENIVNYVCRTKGYPKEILKVIYNGRYVDNQCTVANNGIVHISLTLLGGKGGFGSMLRAIGAQIEKTTNREACRDLSGRRLRDINEEQRLKRWIAKKAEREREAAERRKKKLERLRCPPKHDFQDSEYDRERRDMAERIDDALTHGLKTSNKRKPDEELAVPKKKCLWLGVDITEQEDSDSNNEESNEELSSDSINEIGEKSEDSERSQDSVPPVNNSVSSEVTDAKPSFSNDTDQCKENMTSTKSTSGNSFESINYAKDMCNRLGLKGWIRMSKWGTVVGQIQGVKDRIDEMALWLRLQGSPGARIDQCDFRNWQVIDTMEYRHFNVRF
ncbi:splicing regulator SDE2 isoform X1 [Centruroides vittatus]|uniref:splicing regulator SDE2 isoform X1 n=1 Tax=Centruroides vittatus TaxID=120091 RepID=UPI00350ED249